MPNRVIKVIVQFVGIFFLLTSCGVKKSLQDLPDTSQYQIQIPKRQQLNDSTFTLGNNFLTKNEQGLWELYVDGNPFEIGLKTGSLTQELFQFQERTFIDKINELVPSEGKQRLLKKFLAWYNRKMYLNIDEQFKTEIYGLSQYASEGYDHVAEPYLRVLYFHGAHDIGHALQDLALVGCSSFAAWGDKTEDGKLLIGRNFDFYAGDDFAKNKIIAFVAPDEGHNFMSVTWGGFIGVLSGMNDQGLTVTINAGKSSIPLVAKTPISIVTREILQYASTIEEAITIAKKREVFVSESIFVGSAKDKKAAVIEVSPKKFGVYEVENSDQLICSNHFQSAAYADDKDNQKHILESHSQYRYERMEELLEEQSKMTPESAVDLLRDREGLDEKAIGYGNEKALNQLMAHHGIVFQPEDLLVWVSGNPYQLGEFVAYDLNEIFKKRNTNPQVSSVARNELNIPKDPFLETEAYRDYERYRELSQLVTKAIGTGTRLETSVLKAFEESNPEFWEVHYLIGLYNYNRGYDTLAFQAFQKAETKEITTIPDRERVERYIRKLKRRLH
ncbi:acyl-CoA--6-aminopenicillanic acid acyl-transferase [Flavobacteriaceae bacterium TP-CH-4]|uniref:Acyl-CoA--6-aminopenicillanic acid acyl-transferase n=1 Tax=Pelagihabitans pacificus TaxID=2696054 RepID=A0A967AWR2_9FLAO|nr:C45 family peptidase [Pelagihabitans pacificus]NHF60550.1 acyl-CoA--6-aminopenicillanic acid acyl-transferase [Pelagihabitans pacificus]